MTFCHHPASPILDNRAKTHRDRDRDQNRDRDRDRDRGRDRDRERSAGLLGARLADQEKDAPDRETAGHKKQQAGSQDRSGPGGGLQNPSTSPRLHPTRPLYGLEPLDQSITILLSAVVTFAAGGPPVNGCS